MAIISMPGAAELWMMAIVLIYFALIINTIISIFKRVDLDLTPRLLWVIIILTAPLIGLVLYNFFGSQPRRV